MQSAQALHTVEHESEHGCWTLVRRRPMHALAPYVREYQGYVERKAAIVCRREVPTASIPLIINFAAPFHLHDTNDPARSRPISTFMAGLHERYVTVSSGGAAFCMQVDFSPLGAVRFLGLPLDTLAGQVVDLADLLGGAADELTERLYDAPDWPERFHILDVLIAQRIANATEPLPIVTEAWRRIEAREGRIGIGALARKLDCSRKHLSERFRRDIGLPPKRVARILRFDAAIAALGSGPVDSLAGLALACGYYDQAHFDRDFRAFAGESPTALLKRLLPDGTGIMAGVDGR